MSRNGSRRIRPSPVAVRARHLSYRHPAGERESDGYTVDDVTMSIFPGEVVALVGEHGAGKTSLVKLLCGLHQPAAGKVEWAVGGVNLTLDEMRRRTSILFPEGIDTDLATRFRGGVDLSVGPWQRLTLARARDRGPGFVVLDGPTASLDPSAEAELFAGVRSTFQDSSILLVTHRSGGVRHADVIYTMAGGRIVEQGTHDQLLTAGGPYSRMGERQANQFALADA